MDLVTNDAGVSEQAARATSKPKRAKAIIKKETFIYTGETFKLERATANIKMETVKGLRATANVKRGTVKGLRATANVERETFKLKRETVNAENGLVDAKSVSLLSGKANSTMEKLARFFTPPPPFLKNIKCFFI